MRHGKLAQVENHRVLDKSRIFGDGAVPGELGDERLAAVAEAADDRGRLHGDAAVRVGLRRLLEDRRAEAEVDADAKTDSVEEFGGFLDYFEIFGVLLVGRRGSDVGRRWSRKKKICHFLLLLFFCFF